jgi:hypothetical protein
MDVFLDMLRGPRIVAILLIMPGCLLLGCSVRQQGLARGDAGDGARPSTDASASPETGSSPLPGAGGHAVPLWTSGGGGSARNEAVQVGVTVGGVTPATSVKAASGATVTPGHFVDTLE